MLSSLESMREDIEEAEEAIDEAGDNMLKKRTTKFDSKDPEKIAAHKQKMAKQAYKVLHGNYKKTVHKKS